MPVRRTLLALLFCLPFLLRAQPRTTALGLTYRPIFPVNFLGTGPDESVVNGVDIKTGLTTGFSGGMIIRRGLTDLLSMEFGINYTKRTYGVDITDSGYAASSPYRIIGYELPVSLLAFIQLGENMYMNASLGAGLDAFASSVRVANEAFEQIAVKNHTVNPALNANLGWEYRTYQSGIIYVGATYHRPFTEIYTSIVNYRNNGKDISSRTQITGTYLTADLRYYFPYQKDPRKKKKVVKGD